MKIEAIHLREDGDKWQVTFDVKMDDESTRHVPVTVFRREATDALVAINVAWQTARPGLEQENARLHQDHGGL
jgi:hypothetical protein